MTRTVSRELAVRPSERNEETGKKESLFSNIQIAVLIFIVVSVIIMYVVYQYL